MTESQPHNLDTRRRLGRGLATLLGESRSENSIENSPGVKQVPIEFVRSNSRNPRQSFPETEMEELAASIRERGIIQPIIVRPVVGAANAYEIVAGERRWRAAQRAGQHTVPIISLQIADREALEISIVENIQRSDLNALEEAKGYAQLAADYGYSHADVGRVVGKSRSHVANTLRLLALPEHSRELLSAGAISPGHARALLSIDDPDALADKIVARGLTVRDVEKLNVSDCLGTSDGQSRENDPTTKDLEDRVSLSLGARTEIRNNRRLREIRIKFSDFEQLEYICNKLMQQ